MISYDSGGIGKKWHNLDLMLFRYDAGGNGKRWQCLDMMVGEIA